MGKKLCLCTDCRVLTHEVDGQDVSGQMLAYREWKKHAAKDILHEAEEEHLLYSALVVAATPSRENTLASRPRDLDVVEVRVALFTRHVSR